MPAGDHPEPAPVPALVAPADLLPLPVEVIEREAEAATYARAEKVEATRRAYRSDFCRFDRWCSRRAIAALPATPETVAIFLASEAAM